MLTLGLLLLATPGVVWAQAQTALLQEGAPPPGELSGPMAGASTAIVAGGEALWHNPAGLARNVAPAFSMSAAVLRLGQVRAGGHTEELVQAPALALALSHGVGEDRGYPRLAAGWSLQSAAQDDSRLRTSTDVRGSLADFTGAENLDAAVANGTATFREHSSGTARQNLLAPGAGLAMAISPDLRIGAAIVFERVHLVQSSSTALTLRSLTVDGEDVAADYQASLLATADYSAQVNRLVTAWGLQWNPRAWLALGLTLRLPSQTVGRSGTLQVARHSQLRDNSAEGGFESGGTAQASADKVEVDLQRPQQTQLGLALVGDDMVLELDLRQSAALPAYEVFPALESDADSTTAGQFAAVRTAARSHTALALGLTLALGGEDTFSAGLATWPAAVPSNDDVYRAVDLTLLSLGYGYALGPLSTTLSWSLLTGEAGAVRLPGTAGTPGSRQSLTMRSSTVQVAGSLVF